jgi:hypothetical protein
MSEYNSGAGSATHDMPHRTVDPVGDMDAARDLVHYLKEYAREKPEVAALWCLGIGFVLGWKLKPW